MRNEIREIFSIFRHFLISALVLLCLGVSAPVPQIGAQEANAQETLTNASVIKMVQAHLSADVIVEQIRSNPGKYSLTTDNVIKLKQLGVPDKVIAAMQAKRSTASSSTAGSPPKKEAPEVKSSSDCGATRGKWLPYEKENQLTGSHSRGVVLCESFNQGRDSATVTATCPGDLIFQIVYTSPNKDLAFKLYQPDPTIFLGQVYSHKQRVSVSVRIDDGQVATVSPTTEYTNEATLRFIPKSANSDGSYPAIAALAGEALAGYTESVYRANDLRIELPLNDGESPVIDIKPQDSSFKEFASRCPGSNVHVGPSYTVDQFAALVPGLLHKAAVAHGFDAHGYDKEIDFIIQTVKTCALQPAGRPVHLAGGRVGCPGMEPAYHMFLIGGVTEDISVASGHFSGKPYATSPFRPDVGLYIYQPGTGLWDAGKGFYLTLSIVPDSFEEGRHDSRLDELLRDAHIERNPNAPVAAQTN